MRPFSDYFIFMLFTFVISCTTAKQSGEKEHWSYSGESSPEHWAEIAKNGNCDGKYQSPINIIETKTKLTDGAENQLVLHYAAATKMSKVVNNGHSVQFDFEKGDSILYMGNYFQLIQLHFHEPSEHTVNGVRYPIELHFVHKNDKLNEYAVISILGIEGIESHCFELFKHFLPIKNGESIDVDMSHDLSSLFPEKRNYFSYFGSLTTPPCTENVNWILFQEPIELSEEEVLAFKHNMPLDNYRDQQALNGRNILLVNKSSY